MLVAFRSTRVPHRLAAIMEGESLFNDGTALVLVVVTTTAAMSGTFALVPTARALALAIVGGGLLGAAFGAVGSAVLRRTPDHLTAILASIVLVFATSLLSERVHASPVIAVVVAGLAIGRVARRTMEPSRVLALQGFWETAGFFVNVILFLLVGMQIDARILWDEAVSILLAVFALHAGRAVAEIYGCFSSCASPAPSACRPSGSTSWCSKATSRARSPWNRGARAPGHARRPPRLVAIVFGVTFVTLLTQALPFRAVLRRLGVAGGTRAEARAERARADLIMARRGQAELDELLASGLVSRHDHAERRAAYQRTIIRAERTLRRAARSTVGQAVDHAVLAAQKAALSDAARRAHRARHRRRGDRRPRPPAHGGGRGRARRRRDRPVPAPAARRYVMRVSSSWAPAEEASTWPSTCANRGTRSPSWIAIGRHPARLRGARARLARGRRHEPALLHAAETGSADAVLAMLHRDADNLAVAMLARQQGARRVMARMREPAYQPIYLAAGVTQVLSETDVLVGALAMAVEHEAIAHSMIIGQGHAIAFEMVVRQGTWIVGRSVSEAATHAAFPSACVVAGAAVDGVFDGARGNTTFAVDMRILLVVAKKELGRCLDFFLREG